jgi:hypothetical protein
LQFFRVMRLEGELLVEVFSNVFVFPQLSSIRRLQFSDETISLDFVPDEFEGFVPNDFIDSFRKEVLQVSLFV